MTPDVYLEILQRIEAKLDALLAALAEDAADEEQPAVTLDGTPAGAARDNLQSL